LQPFFSPADFRGNLSLAIRAIRLLEFGLLRDLSWSAASPPVSLSSLNLRPSIGRRCNAD
jgi:hypothetical protein